MDKLILLIIVLALLAVFILLTMKGKKQIVYKMLCALVDEAEEIFGAKTGKLKFSYVVKQIYALLPSTIKIFISYKTLEKWIEKALEEMREYWKQKAKNAEQSEIAE